MSKAYMSELNFYPSRANKSDIGFAAPCFSLKYFSCYDVMTFFFLKESEKQEGRWLVYRNMNMPTTGISMA